MRNMRICLLLFFSMFITAEMASQQRYLISPNSEVIPLSQEENSATIIQRRSHGIASSADTCTDKFTFGYHPEAFPITSSFGSYHRDVIGQWFVVPASGTIDTIFWMNSSTIGAYDSTIYLRVHRSNISKEYGPGARPGPFNPPCQNWGYWRNTNDPDNGIAAFIEDATETTWISTINSPVPSTPPFGEELWGLGGYPVRIKPNAVNFAVMSDLNGPIDVKVGDKIFISMRINHENNAEGGHIEAGTEVRTTWGASGFRTSTGDPDYPSPNWKFYEHEGMATSCSGMPVDSVKQGWVARGGSAANADSLDVLPYNIWYGMTVTTNVPPEIDVHVISPATFDWGPYEVSAFITDCNIINPGNAGVAGAQIQYIVNDVEAQSVIMMNVGGDHWQGTIPSYPGGSTIRYRIKAVDIDSATAYSAYEEFRILTFGNDWYSIDTSSNCAMQSIRDDGATVPRDSFFGSAIGPSNNALENGTAGPFDMGGDFDIFGDTFRYAWIGVNGGIALSKSPTDTIDVNARGQYSSSWDFPYPQYSDRYTTGGRMPPMFIAPLWTDLTLGDNNISCGRIVYGNNGDTCQFIIEWDSLTTFDGCGQGAYTDNTFRVILNRCDGTIEFQYEWNAAVDNWQPFLIGIQNSDDMTGQWIFINKDGYPEDTRPHENWCIKMTPKDCLAILDGWNLVSMPCEPVDSNSAKTHLFPQAVSKAFSFNGGYVIADTLETGKGYWMKFNGDCLGNLNVKTCSTYTFVVHDGINLIGSISCPVPTSSIILGGGTVAASPFYGYAGAYYPSTVIYPGAAYWVKITGDGTLTMTCPTNPPMTTPYHIDHSLENANKLNISDANGNIQSLYIVEQNMLPHEVSYYELPPLPPAGGFDARFVSTQGTVAVFPETLFTLADFPITIQSSAPPFTVNLENSSDEYGHFRLIYGHQSFELSDNKNATITAINGNTIVLRVIKDKIPARFALSQGYPNPFNPTTEFRIELPQQSHVEVAVYDLLGRKIASLLNEEKSAGQYRLEWNGQDSRGLPVPTGMYFIRMTAGEFTDSKKIVLLK